MSNNRPVLRAMISSTTLDLPAHRVEAMDACLRQDFFPLMMEHLPADSIAGLAASMRLVDQADLYILIVGARYGFVPAGEEKSITHAEYERAAARGIPILPFIADGTHPFPLNEIETGVGAEKLEAFRREIQAKHVFSHFHSAAELGKLIVDSVARYRSGGTPKFHFVSDVQTPPAAYIAHPYVLLDSTDVIGRQEEFDLLTDWATGASDELAAVRVMVLVAIGGMGKSALTWKWFSDIAPEEMRPLAGRMWWSFYESDATFENFVVRALAYVRCIPREEALAIPAAEREQQLLEVLDAEPFLICLDGLERIMVAYARSDAPTMEDDALDVDAENFIRAMPGAPEYAVESMGNRKRLRKTTDPRAGAFLRKLSRSRASRILISTRLYPAELQSTTGVELGGCKALFLRGLKDHDAVALWRALGVRGRRDALLRIFRTVDNYPLLIRILAGEIAHFREAPGDVDAWLDAHSSFDPFSIPLIQRKTHILRFAMRGLSSKARQVLVTLAAFRMPAAYGILSAIFVGEEATFLRPSDLHEALSELEDRGLVGWDRRANRYDLHPVVRGVVWHGLNRVGRDIVLERLHEHLTTLPPVPKVVAPSVDDLTPAIELYHARIALGRQDEAFAFFREYLHDVLIHRMSRFRDGAQILEALFPEGIAAPPALNDPKNRHLATWSLAYCYQYTGEPGRALPVLPRLIEEATGKDKPAAMNNHASALFSIGRLAEAETVIADCLMKFKDVGPAALARHRAQLGSLTSQRGDFAAADPILDEAMKSFAEIPAFVQPSDFAAITKTVQHLLRQRKLDEARRLARRAMTLSLTTNIVQIRIEALESFGWSQMLDGCHGEAESTFSDALTRAREIGSSDSEVGLLLALAELYQLQGKRERARDTLADVWEPLQRGPLRVMHAWACNILAEIELASGHLAEATDAASVAFRLAWCDGPPYALAEELERSRNTLRRCGVREPTIVNESLP